MNNFLIDGKNFGDDAYCYIGIFSNTGAKEEEYWYVGTNFMKSYYTIFDMSGLTNPD